MSHESTLLHKPRGLPVMAVLHDISVQDSMPWIEHGFRCDFGCYISFGRDVFINYNCVGLGLPQLVQL